jgi:glutathione S-transferase
LLTHYETPYVEERHALLFSPFYTLQRARTILFPALVSGPSRLSKARDIVDAYDPRAPVERRLLREGAEGQQLERDWVEFNQKLGFASAIFGYYHLLKHRDIMIRPLSEGTPALEQRTVELAYPLYANTLRLLLALTSARAQSSLDTARSIADGVDHRLSDRRPYLLGSGFSLSDMAFAVSLAPLVLPEGYGGPLPGLAEVPPAVRSAVEEMRQRPCGQFALRIYAKHRGGSRPKADNLGARRSRTSSRVS